MRSCALKKMVTLVPLSREGRRGLLVSEEPERKKGPCERRGEKYRSDEADIAPQRLSRKRQLRSLRQVGQNVAAEHEEHAHRGVAVENAQKRRVQSDCKVSKENDAGRASARAIEIRAFGSVVPR
jgi:hypothetical protein